VASSGQIFDSVLTEFVDSLWADLLDSSRLIFYPCGQPLFTLVWTGVRLYFTTSFHTCIARSEVGVRLPLFKPMLIGVMQRSFAVGALVYMQFGSDVSILDVCGG
jgi:hypothetical protein